MSAFHGQGPAQEDSSLRAECSAAELPGHRGLGAGTGFEPAHFGFYTLPILLLVSAE